MQSGRTMGYTLCERYFVSYHTASPPSDDEWREHLLFVDRRLTGLRGILVVTDGGGPNVVQRAQLAELFQGRMPLVAVITDSAVVRGVLVALSWFGGKQRAFAPSDLDKALAFLGASGPASVLIVKAIEQLRADVGAARARAGNDA